MKNVVVAAACRKAGKTLLASALVRNLVGLGYVVSAFKLCHKPGEPLRTASGAAREGSDTQRFRDAGASRVSLVVSPDPDGIADALESLPGSEDVCIWESNAAARILTPDLLIYIGVAGCRDPKDPDLAGLANIVAEGPLTAEAAAVLAERAAGRLGLDPKDKERRP